MVLHVKIRQRVRKLFHSWRSTRDSGWFAIARSSLQSKYPVIWVALSCDIDARELFCAFFRSVPPPIRTDSPFLVLSTHILRRLNTNLKLTVLSAISRIRRRPIAMMSTDGLAGATLAIHPYKLLLVSQWFNSPDEADEYWGYRPKLLRRTRRVEYFPERPGLVDPEPIEGLTRLSRNFVLADPSRLSDHFPSIKQIVFASDITIALRKEAVPVAQRLGQHLGTDFDLDELIWREAHERVNGNQLNLPFYLDSLLTRTLPEFESSQRLEISEIELDALRLTLHGRERYLFIRSLAESDLAPFLCLIGSTWTQFPDLRPFISTQKRFPGGQKVTDFQRSRVCPDFGSSLGSMPLYGRAQIIAGRAVGLLQRKDLRGNPLVVGLEDVRTFSNVQELIDRSIQLLEIDESVFFEQERQIRKAYTQLATSERGAFLDLAMSSLLIG